MIPYRKEAVLPEQDVAQLPSRPIGEMDFVYFEDPDLVGEIISVDRDGCAWVAILGGGVLRIDVEKLTRITGWRDLKLRLKRFMKR